MARLHPGLKFFEILGTSICVTSTSRLVKFFGILQKFHNKFREPEHPPCYFSTYPSSFFSTNHTRDFYASTHTLFFFANHTRSSFLLARLIKYIYGYVSHHTRTFFHQSRAIFFRFHSRFSSPIAPFFLRIHAHFSSPTARAFSIFTSP